MLDTEDFEIKKQLDPDLMQYERVETINENIVVYYSAHKAPSVVSNRDYVGVNYLLA